MTPDWPPAHSLDARDSTPEPPAMLDPLWVLAMRRRVLSHDWPALRESRERGEERPRWEQ